MGDRGHNRHGPKLGAVPLLRGGELDPHLIQRRLGEVYFRTKCHLDPFSHLATIDMGQKLVGELCPYWGSWVSIENSLLDRGLPPSQVTS